MGIFANPFNNPNSVSSVLSGSKNEKDNSFPDLDYHTALQDDRSWSEHEAQKSRDWSKMMEDTRYQRTVEDMVKAGINPMYLFSGGSVSGHGQTSVASTPSTATSKQIQANELAVRQLMQDKQFSYDLIRDVVHSVGQMVSRGAGKPVVTKVYNNW